MEKEEQIDRIESFLKNVVMGELGKIQQTDTTFMPFVLMGQAIEILGGFIDNKPMKTPGQASKRFSAGVKYLFGGRYWVENDNFYLYNALRNQMTHAFIPSHDLLLFRTTPEGNLYRHLVRTQDGKLVLIGDVFYNDICKACDRLIQLLKDGKIKAKNIAYSDED